MKSFWLLMAASMVLIFGCLLPDQEATAAAAENPTQSGWGNSALAGDVAVVVRVPADTAGELTAFALRKGPTLRERRAMGLTLRNVRKTLAEMQKAGELEDKDSATIAVEVLDRLIGDNPAAFQNAAIDWDRILEFLERLIPLILKIIALFS